MFRYRKRERGNTNIQIENNHERRLNERYKDEPKGKEKKTHRQKEEAGAKKNEGTKKERKKERKT